MLLHKILALNIVGILKTQESFTLKRNASKLQNT